METTNKKSFEVISEEEFKSILTVLLISFMVSIIGMFLKNKTLAETGMYFFVSPVPYLIIKTLRGFLK